MDWVAGALIHKRRGPINGTLKLTATGNRRHSSVRTTKGKLKRQEDPNLIVIRHSKPVPYNYSATTFRYVRNEETAGAANRTD